jgi:hypothetical protein
VLREEQERFSQARGCGDPLDGFELSLHKEKPRCPLDYSRRRSTSPNQVCMEEWGSRRVEERLEFEGESREHFVIAVDEAVVKRSS